MTSRRGEGAGREVGGGGMGLGEGGGGGLGGGGGGGRRGGGGGVGGGGWGGVGGGGVGSRREVEGDDSKSDKISDDPIRTNKTPSTISSLSTS